MADTELGRSTEGNVKQTDESGLMSECISEGRGT